VIEAVEWLPSGADSGLVRVRGLWTDEAAREDELPGLVLRAAGNEHRFDSLPDARFSRDPLSWRGTYLVPAELVATDPEALWLLWPSGARCGLPPVSRGAEPPPVPAAPERPEVPPSQGGQVIDRAVLAERRARRAEAAEEAQAKVAGEALKAVEVLELRSAELERRLEEATAALEARPAAPNRDALAAALASAAAMRARARELQLRLRTSEVSRSSDAVRLAGLEAERMALRDRSRELEGLRREALAAAAELAAAREAASSARVDVEREQAGRASLESTLSSVRGELEAARAEAAATAAELVDARDQGDSARARAEEVTAELAGTSSRLATAETMLAAAEARLRVETVARTTLEDQLDQVRASFAPAGEALEAARADLATARSDLTAREAELTAARTDLAGRDNDLAAAQADLTARDNDLAAARNDLIAANDALAAARADVAAREADLTAARTDLTARDADLAAAREEIASLTADRALVDPLRAEVEAERAARAAAEQALAEARNQGASFQDRIAELEQQDAGRLEQLAEEQAQAAAAAPPAEASDKVVADLDAAAEKLRRAEPAPAPGPRIVSPSRQPPRGLVVGSTRRDYPRLRGAIVKLAHDDPATAGRLLAALLPAQGALLPEAVAYDLTIGEVGTFGVTVAGKRTYVERLERPRPRGQADFHLSGDALALAELLAGVDHRIGRFFGGLRVRGRRNRVDVLRALPGAQSSLAEAARAGAKLDPELVYRAFAYAVHPSWTRSHTFTVAQEITGDLPETWYLTARDGAGLAVSSSPPAGGPDATVSMSRTAFDQLLRGETATERPAVRGDRAAVDRMRLWTLRAQGSESGGL
jgi:hypothetical protein